AIAAAAAAMDDHDARSALAHAERAIALEPLDERGYHAGLVALHALGRDRDAIALYDRCCTAIEDAEAPPVSDALRSLRATIGRREAIELPEPGAGRRTTDVTRRPVPDHLLGRREDLEALRRALEVTRDGGSGLLLIEGEPGIGKTTLLEAASGDLDG